jgi:hypothetical protein
MRLHPRYAPLIVDGPFDLPMVIDGPREVEQLDYVIEQLRRALKRLSCNEALQEVRGAIREYRDSEKRQKSVIRRSQLLSSYAAFRERPHSPQLESSHPEGTTGVADH